MNDIGRQLNDISISPDGTMIIPQIQLNHIVQMEVQEKETSKC